MKIAFSLALLLATLPAFAADPAPSKPAGAPEGITAPEGSTVTYTQGPDGQWTVNVAPPAPPESPEEKAAELERYRSNTVAQPYTPDQVKDEGNDLFGGSNSFSTQVSDCIAVATSQARLAKLKVIGDINARCREIAVKQSETDNARLALTLGSDYSRKGDGEAVGHDPATVFSSVNGNNGYGYGYGVYGGYQQVAYDTAITRAAMDRTASGGPMVLETPGGKDLDSDGILNDADRCPTQAETVNNFEDSDGCPDVVPPKATADKPTPKAEPTAEEAQRAADAAALAKIHAAEAAAK